MSGPIRLFVGVDGGNCDLESQAVLEYSLRQHASEDVVITWMQQAATGPYAGWTTSSGRTPFSHFRWSAPAMCGFAGRAIYTDSDFIFTADLAEFWHQDIPGVLLLKDPTGKLKTCCLLFDCAKAKGIVPTLAALKAHPNPNDAMLQHFRTHRAEIAAFAGDWNCIDGGSYASLADPRIKAIHYSRIETQLQLRHAIARLAAEGKTHWYTGEVRTHWRADLIAVFDRLLVEATAAGYPPEHYRVIPFEAVRRSFQYSHHRGSAA